MSIPVALLHYICEEPSVILKSLSVPNIIFFSLTVQKIMCGALFAFSAFVCLCFQNQHFIEENKTFTNHLQVERGVSVHSGPTCPIATTQTSANNFVF
jgi:hypothetical protein